jgi:uncharacterized protein
MRYIIFKDSTGQWRWHLRAANGRVIANSGEGYGNKADCQSAIELVKLSSAALIHEH